MLDNALSVSQYLALANEQLLVMQGIAIQGEISGYSSRQNKWIFFSLKDAVSVIECFAISFNIKIPLSDGMKVRVVGYSSIYEKSGRFRYTVHQIEMVESEGDLKKAYNALKKKLESEGLFSSERKRVLPTMPTRIGFIGSRDSAACSDFVKIVQNRWSGITIQLYDVVTQGDNSPREIVKAYQFFNTMFQQNPDSAPEVIVMSRGGGSLEDLKSFNDESVARAVFSSLIPVVCGVGHEKDESLADFVADRRASTPTHAAELVVPDMHEILREISQTVQYIEHTLSAMIRKNMKAVDVSRGIIAMRMHNMMMKYNEAVRAKGQLLLSFSPHAILQRGYSITYAEDGSVVRNEDVLSHNQKVRLRFAEGNADALIQKI